MGYCVVTGAVEAVSIKSARVRVESVDGQTATGVDWFPLSQCEELEGAEPGDDVEFDCPTWLLEEKEVDW